MAIIYVAGPVPKDSWKEVSPAVRRHLDTVEEIYATINGITRFSRHQLWLPEQESFLDHAKPQEFFSEITDRIAKADVVITVLSPFDLSAAAESTIASMSGKRQLLILNGFHSAPRIMEGMPAMQVVNGDDTAELARALSAFLGPETQPPLRVRAR